MIPVIFFIVGSLCVTKNGWLNFFSYQSKVFFLKHFLNQP